MTQKEYAIKGMITPEMIEVAKDEGCSAEFIQDGVKNGTIVICKNKNHHNVKPLGVGKGLKTKVNANIGTSKDQPDANIELEKLKSAVRAGTDAVMDLSTGGEIEAIRKLIISESKVAVGTVPIYQAAINAVKKGKSLVEMTVDDLFNAIEKQGKDGVDFITVHCGINKESLTRLANHKRIMGIVSRGGAFTAEWMRYNKKENPLYEHFDRLCSIAKEYDMTLSLGDGLRPGCLADATDRGQVQELINLGELTLKAWEKGVQVMIEGPGHVPINQIEGNIMLQKRLCHDAPFYVLGPLVTDCAPGYDHITSAIGGAIAAMAGADFLCYVTPGEHLRLPTISDVKEGVIAAKIAGHAADIAKGVKGAMERDIKLSKARKALDWETQYSQSLDPEKARKMREEYAPADSDVCTMCAEFCAIKVQQEKV